MIHMPSLEIWEWGFKIFDGPPTLTTHVNHLLLSTEHKTHNKYYMYNIDIYWTVYTTCII